MWLKKVEVRKSEISRNRDPTVHGNSDEIKTFIGRLTLTKENKLCFYLYLTKRACRELSIMKAWTYTSYRTKISKQIQGALLGKAIWRKKLLKTPINVKTPAGIPITFFHLACSLLSTDIPQAEDRRGANDPTFSPQFEQTSYLLCLQTFPNGNYRRYICMRADGHF